MRPGLWFGLGASALAVVSLEAAWAGQVAGEVRDPSLNPVEGAWVVAYDARLNYAYAATDENGEATVDGLPAGRYRVRVLPPQPRNVVERWAGTDASAGGAAGLDVCAGTVWDVGEDEGVAVEVPLAAGGAIRGVLQDQVGQPVAGARVTAISADGLSLQRRTATSDADGAFAVVGLPLGATGQGTGWVLEVEADGWPDQYVPEVYAEEDAEVVDASAAGAELGAVALLDGIVIGGAVDGPWGPVENATLSVYSGSQVRQAEVEDGRYEVMGLPPGEALAWGSATGLALTYTPDSDRPGERVSILEEGAVYEDLDLWMPAESTLRGRLLAPGINLSEVTLLTLNDDRTVGLGESVDADGNFEVDRLHPGDYTLLFYASDEGFVDDVVRTSSGEARVFSVAFGENDAGDVVLPLGNGVSGTVTDAATGEPVYGALVRAEEVETGDSDAALTDRDGNYRLDGLADGRWEITIVYTAYCAVDEDWVAVAYPGAVNPALVGVLRLSGGEAVEWDAALPPDHDHDGMDDVWEAERGLDPTVNDADLDLDDDGYTNLEEYWYGTDPLSAGKKARRGCGCSSPPVGPRLWLWAMLGGLAAVRRRPGGFRVGSPR